MKLFRLTGFIEYSGKRCQSFIIRMFIAKQKNLELEKN